MHIGIYVILHQHRGHSFLSNDTWLYKCTQRSNTVGTRVHLYSSVLSGFYCHIIYKSALSNHTLTPYPQSWHMHTHTHTYTHTPTHTYSRTHAHAHTHIPTYARTRTHARAYTPVTGPAPSCCVCNLCRRPCLQLRSLRVRSASPGAQQGSPSQKLHTQVGSK